MAYEVQNYLVDPLPFEVEAVDPSGLISVNDGHVTAVRRFKMKWKEVEEFRLRVLGKWYQAEDITIGDQTFKKNFYPTLPAFFPDVDGKYSIVATSVTIDMEKSSRCGFNVSGTNDDEEYEQGLKIKSLVNPRELELYYYQNEEEVPDQSDAIAVVQVNYTEPEWDCTSTSGFLSGLVLKNTGIRTEINPTYEMYTLPSRNLVFSDIEKDEDTDRSLKPENQAYMIIPKADVIVHWSNIPVSLLCRIYEHLDHYRGKVNHSTWGEVLYCGVWDDGESTTDEVCKYFPAETLMFVDYEENLSRRTYGFAGEDADMNTTTLTLHFKMKKIPYLDRINVGSSDAYDPDVPADPEPVMQEPVRYYGWNHAPIDHSADGGTNERWGRVKQVINGAEKDLFERVEFSKILHPEIYDVAPDT